MPTTIDPIALFAAARELDLEAALWLQPSEGSAIVGIGRAWAVEPGGPGRFAVADRSWRALLAGSVGHGGSPELPDPPRGAGPVLLGGLGFTGRRPADDDEWAAFGPASLVLPALAFARTPDGAYVTAATLGGDGTAARAHARRWDALVARARDLAPAAGALVARPAVAPLAITAEQPDRASWDRLVGLFAGAVGRGRLDKVVLARRVALRSPLELDPVNALRRLAAAGPESTIFAFVRDDVTFLGATPERLVRTEGRAFRTAAVAGSAPRGADATEDARLAAGLLASDKEREEHAVVVTMLRDALRPDRGAARRRADPGDPRPAPRAAPRHADRGHPPGGDRDPGPGRAVPPDAGGRRRAARRRPGPHRRARRLRPRLVRRAGRLAGSGRRRRADGGPPLRAGRTASGRRSSPVAGSWRTPIRHASGRNRG